MRKRILPGSIPESKRLEMHRYLVGSGQNSLDETSAADIFDWQSGIFFIAFFFDIRRKLGQRIGLFLEDDLDEDEDDFFLWLKLNRIDTFIPVNLLESFQNGKKTVRMLLTMYSIWL